MRGAAAKQSRAAFAECMGGLPDDGLGSPSEKNLVSGETNMDHGDEPQQPYRVRLPGFLIEEEVGLGDAIKRMTYAIGIKPCGGCERRAAILNRWVRFSR
jgi:hypothetical protein